MLLILLNLVCQLLCTLRDISSVTVKSDYPKLNLHDIQICGLKSSNLQQCNRGLLVLLQVLHTVNIVQKLFVILITKDPTECTEMIQ